MEPVVEEVVEEVVKVNDKSKIEETSKVVYGQVGNEYLTPYQTTVIYHPDSYFETAVAFLSKRAQLIPIYSTIDFSTVADACEHISPEVVIFGNEFSREDLLKFLTRGFQFIHIYTDDTKYVDFGEDTENSQIKPFNLSTITFQLDTLYDHIVLTPGAMPVYILEHILCAETSYKSEFAQITTIAGKYLLRAIEFSKCDFGEFIIRLVASARGFDELTTLITRGKAIYECNEAMANSRIVNGMPCVLEADESDESLDSKVAVLAICSTDLRTELMNLVPAHPSCVGLDFVMLYEFEPHVCSVPSESNNEENVSKPEGIEFNEVDKQEKIYSGWRVTLVRLGKESPSAEAMLKKYSEYASGTVGSATVWIPKEDSHKLLPFIYSSAAYTA